MLLKRKYRVPELPDAGPIPGTNLTVIPTEARKHTVVHYETSQDWLRGSLAWPDRTHNQYATLRTSRLLIQNWHKHLVATALPVQTADGRYLGFYIQDNKPGSRGFCILREEGNLSSPGFTYIQDKTGEWHQKDRNYFCTEQFKYNNGPPVDVINAIIDDHAFHMAQSVKGFVHAFENLPDVREIARQKLRSKGHNPENVLHIDTSHLALKPNTFSDYVWVSDSINITELDAYLEGLHPDISDIGWVDDDVEHTRHIFHLSINSDLPPIILPLYKAIAENQLRDHHPDAWKVVHNALTETNDAKIILPDIYGYKTRDMAYFVHGNETDQFLGVLITLGATESSVSPAAHIFRSNQDKADFFKRNRSFLSHYVAPESGPSGFYAGAYKAIEGIGSWRPRSNEIWPPHRYFTYEHEQITSGDIQRLYGISREYDVLSNPSNYQDPLLFDDVKQNIFHPKSGVLPSCQGYKADIYGYPLHDMVYYEKIGPNNTFDDPDFFGVLVDYGPEASPPLPRVTVFKNQQDIADFLFHNKQALYARLNTSDLPDGKTYEGALHAIDDMAAWVPQNSNLAGWIPSQYFNSNRKTVSPYGFGRAYTEQTYTVLEATLRSSYTSHAAYTGRMAAYYASLVTMAVTPFLLPLSFAGEGLIAAAATGIGIGLGAADTGINIYWADAEYNPDMKAQAIVGAVMGAAGTVTDISGLIIPRINIRRFISPERGFKNGIVLHACEEPVYIAPQADPHIKHIQPSHPDTYHMIGSPIRLGNHLPGEHSLLPKGSILFEGEHGGHMYMYNGPSKKWDNTSPLFQHIGFTKNGEVVFTPIDEGTFQLTPPAFQHMAQTENLPKVTVTLSKKGATAYDISYRYYDRHGSFQCSIEPEYNDPLKNLAHIVQFEQATERYITSSAGKGVLSKRTPHVQQYGENGFGIPLDDEHIIPVQWDHNNQTWRAYIRDEPTKPTLPITYQEETGHWIINHDIGLPGGAPTGKNWAQFKERWLDKMQDYVCDLLGPRESHVTEHVGQPEHKLRTLVDQGYQKKCQGVNLLSLRKPTVTKEATFSNKSECERILACIFTQSHGSTSEAKQKGANAIRRAQEIAAQLRASRGGKQENTFSIEVKFSKATGKGIQRIDKPDQQTEYRDYQPMGVHVVIAANPNVHNGWYIKTAYPI